MATKLEPGLWNMSFRISREMPEEYISNMLSERKETLIARFLATAEPGRHYTFMFHEEIYPNGPPLYDSIYNIHVSIGEVEKVPVYIPEFYQLPPHKMTARQLIVELFRRLWPIGKK